MYSITRMVVWPCSHTSYVSALHRTNSVTSKRKVSSVSSEVSEQEPVDEPHPAPTPGYYKTQN